MPKLFKLFIGCAVNINLMSDFRVYHKHPEVTLFIGPYIIVMRLALSSVRVAACNTDTTQTQPHQISNTQRTENKTTDVVIQQHSCKLLMMDILMSETCWTHKKWNQIASDIKLVFYSSTLKSLCYPAILKIGHMPPFCVEVVAYRCLFCLNVI